MFKKFVLIAGFGALLFGGNFEEATKAYVMDGVFSVKVFGWFEKSCSEDKNAAGCFITGYAHKNYLVEDANLTKANNALKLSCDMGDMDGCVSVADMYNDGDGEVQDYARARELYERACEADNATACYKLASQYDGGLGVKIDFVKALTLYKKACDGQNGDACYAAANMYETGDGTDVDMSMAMELYGLACDYEHDGGCAKFRALSKAASKK